MDHADGEIFEIAHGHDDDRLPCGHTGIEHQAMGYQMKVIDCTDLLEQLTAKLAIAQSQVRNLTADRQLIAQLLAAAARQAGGRMDLPNHHRLTGTIGHVMMLHGCNPDLMQPCTSTVIAHTGAPEDCNECRDVAARSGIQPEEFNASVDNAVDTGIGKQINDRFN